MLDLKLMNIWYAKALCKVGAVQANIPDNAPNVFLLMEIMKNLFWIASIFSGFWLLAIFVSILRTQKYARWKGITETETFLATVINDIIKFWQRTIFSLKRFKPFSPLYLCVNHNATKYSHELHHIIPTGNWTKIYTNLLI